MLLRYSAIAKLVKNSAQSKSQDWDKKKVLATMQLLQSRILENGPEIWIRIFGKVSLPLPKRIKRLKLRSK